MITSGMKTSNTYEWATPQQLFDELDKEFNFTLDPCCTKDNAKCRIYYTKEQDGLSHNWNGHRVFMNSPYGRHISNWLCKAFEAKAMVVCLVPARTDTRWWHDYCMKANEIRFVKGRLYFNDGEGRAPFPSAVIIFKGKMRCTKETQNKLVVNSMIVNRKPVNVQ